MRRIIEPKTIIIGCGRLGASIANTLSLQNKCVTVIDISKDSFRKLDSSFGGMFMEGDGTDIELLKELEFKKEDTFVVVTDDDNRNILIAQMAKKIFQIEEVIVRLYDPEKACVLAGMDIKSIFPSLLSANEVNKILEEGNYYES